jgi:hypothetical protein
LNSNNSNQYRESDKTKLLDRKLQILQLFAVLTRQPRTGRSWLEERNARPESQLEGEENA